MVHPRARTPELRCKAARVCTRGNTTVINATERYVFEIPDPTPTEERKTLWRMLGF